MTHQVSLGGTYAPINDEEKLTQHMKFVRELAAKHGMNHDNYKITPGGRLILPNSICLALISMSRSQVERT